MRLLCALCIVVASTAALAETRFERGNISCESFLPEVTDGKFTGCSFDSVGEQKVDRCWFTVLRHGKPERYIGTMVSRPDPTVSGITGSMRLARMSYNGIQCKLRVPNTVKVMVCDFEGPKGTCAYVEEPVQGDMPRLMRADITVREDRTRMPPFPPKP